MKNRSIIKFQFINGVILYSLIWIITISSFAVIFLIAKPHPQVTQSPNIRDNWICVKCAISCGPRTPTELPEEPSMWQIDHPPSPLNIRFVKNEIKYPALAFDQKIEGKVRVKVLIDTSGNISKIGSISGPEVFHTEIRINITKLKFKPAINNGKAVKCWVSVPFNFKLKKEK